MPTMDLVSIGQNNPVAYVSSWWRLFYDHYNHPGQQSHCLSLKSWLYDISNFLSTLHTIAIMCIKGLLQLCIKQQAHARTCLHMWGWRRHVCPQRIATRAYRLSESLLCLQNAFKGSLGMTKTCMCIEHSNRSIQISCLICLQHVSSTHTGLHQEPIHCLQDFSAECIHKACTACLQSAFKAMWGWSRHECA